MPYDDGMTGPGKSAEVDAIAHAAAAELKALGQAGPCSATGDQRHDANEMPQGNPGSPGYSPERKQ